MGLEINVLAVIAALNERVGGEISFSELKYLYRFHGGQKGRLGDSLERVVRRWPDCVEWANRIGDGRRLEVWVRVVQRIDVPENTV
jgi:hypothetical protein